MRSHLSACVEAISEAHLEPALEAALTAFPFVILGFHSDNGSEYINGTRGGSPLKGPALTIAPCPYFRAMSQFLRTPSKPQLHGRNLTVGFLRSANLRNWQVYCAGLSPLADPIYPVSEITQNLPRRVIPKLAPGQVGPGMDKAFTGQRRTGLPGFGRSEIPDLPA